MYPQEYLDYLVYFHAERDYFECHEVLEEYWKSQEMKKKVWVGLIQIAVSLYHHRRNNFTGASKMMESAYLILKEEEVELAYLGIHYKQLIAQLGEKIKDIKNLRPYHSLNLPLEANLLKQCERICRQQGLGWGKASDLKNEYLLNKHTLRDRSEVIKERENNKALRQQKQENNNSN
jgi:predicted metal-dependent hydrolase